MVLPAISRTGAGTTAGNLSLASFSTTDDLSDPDSWSPLRLLRARQADGKSGLDFWIICDEEKAHLFFTTLDGRMWRQETSLGDFPHGWSEPELALKADIFEASHTYRLRGMDKYLTVIEAQHGHGWRYYKAYLADRLEGPWTPLAATKDQTVASMVNTDHPSPRWTDNISHGELLRCGRDQRLGGGRGDRAGPARGRGTPSGRRPTAHSFCLCHRVSAPFRPVGRGRSVPRRHCQ